MLQYFNKMTIEYGTEPNIVTYGIIIDAFATRGQPEKMLEYFQRMKEAKIQPNLPTFNILLKGFAACNDINNAVKYWEEMNQLGLHPDETTVNIMMDMFGKRGETEEMLKYWKKMTEELSKYHCYPIVCNRILMYASISLLFFSFIQ